MPSNFEESTKLLNGWIRNNPVYPTNGYQTTMPQYNPYRRVDYKPIQISQTPPINQALKNCKKN